MNKRMQEEYVTVSVFTYQNVCLLCLTETKNVKNLLTAEEESVSLLKTLESFSNLKLQELENNKISTSLCCGCIEQLKSAYDFQIRCNSACERFEQFLNEVSANHEVPDDDGNQTNECKTESTSDLEEDQDSPKDNISIDSKKQTVRLAQYSLDKVTKAIEEVQKGFLENTMCIKCGFIGTNSRALSVHMSYLHKDIKDRWCSFCNLEVDNLEEHTKEHENNDLKCQFCGKVFNRKSHLTEHLKGHGGVRPYKCTVCNKCFISTGHLKIHSKVHTVSSSYVCPLCKKSFSQSAILSRHLKLEHYCKTFCKKCYKVFPDEVLSPHECPGSKNHCKICNKRVRSLDVHIQQFHEKPAEPKLRNEETDPKVNFKLCTICGKQLRTSTKLRVHMRTHTGDYPYKCSYCDRRTVTRSHLINHERTHTGEKPYICTVCGKRFVQSSVLKTHMKIHTGKPEICPFCEHRFSRPAELRLHLRKHTGEKPFICQTCGQAFAQSSHLVVHSKSHSSIRPLSCNYCDRTFKLQACLKKHLQIHSGFKPYRCNQCPYACRQSHSLTQHMRKHNSDTPKMDRPHICHLCNKRFTTAAMLSSHINVWHQEQVSVGNNYYGSIV